MTLKIIERLPAIQTAEQRFAGGRTELGDHFRIGGMAVGIRRSLRSQPEPDTSLRIMVPSGCGWCVRQIKSRASELCLEKLGLPLERFTFVRSVIAACLRLPQDFPAPVRTITTTQAVAAVELVPAWASSESSSSRSTGCGCADASLIGDAGAGPFQRDLWLESSLARRDFPRSCSPRCDEPSTPWSDQFPGSAGGVGSSLSPVPMTCWVTSSTMRLVI